MLNLIICGAPGSGKGTQSDLLVEKYNLKHLSTGDLLRSEIEAKTPAGQLADSYISQGQLVPDEMIVEMLDTEMDKINGNYNGLILDGFPRTVAQAESLVKLLEKRNKSIDLLIDVDVEETELIERLLKRGETSGRNDDNIHTIKKRLTVYHEKTKPVSNFFKKRNQYALIDGMGGVHEIHNRIAHLIEKHRKRS
jgi:Adenylate kinase and related kinases